MKINGKWFGYCTNVHAGFDLDVTMENLSRFAVPVKNRCSPDEPMGIGLWLSDQTAIDLLSQDRVSEFRGWLDEQGLVPFTFNGFPYGNFHQEEVKKQVYLPTWADDSRREYSERLAQIQNELLPEGMEGSISTLPLAWDSDSSEGDSADADLIQQSTDQLIELAEFLEELEERTGRLIYFCIEPEPGCIIQNSQTCIDFFERFLLGESSGRDELVRRYLRVCHDICHSAVMFEDQSEFIGNLYSAGLKIGKVQVSSAVHAKFEGGQSARDQQILQQLSQFKEPRYLHQTVLRNQRDETLFFEDLAPALEELSNNVDSYREARVHFHVPLHLKEFGALGTSQTEIYQCFDTVQNIEDLHHFEAETYAWNVLPAELQHDDLADGLTEEIKWLADL